MMYIDKSKVFFVHIPKCGGMDLKQAFRGRARFPRSELAADIGISPPDLHGFRHDHPVLGPIAPTHIPLPFLSAHFPRVWALFADATSFALVREPRARFISALTQRLIEFKEVSAPRLDDDLIQREAEEVCTWLEGRDAFCDLEYAHFTQQIDYTHLNGEQRVGHIFPLECTGTMVAWLARAHNLKIEMTHRHTRLQPRKWFTGMQPAVRVLARGGLPKPVREVLYPLWRKSGLFTPAAAHYDKLAFAPDVEAFIARYYAEDAALYRRLLKQLDAACASAND